MQRARTRPSLTDPTPWSVSLALAWAAVACGLALASVLFV
jgi:hypothetical protein